MIRVPTPDPRLTAITDSLRALAPAPTHAAKRAAIDAGAADAVERVRASGVIVTEVDADGVPCLLVEPPGAAPGGTLVGLHGGGYVVCSARTHLERFARMGAQAAWRTLVVDYRLAPEHPFPAALDDAVAAVTWAGARFAGPVALVGDSAGGGLALATLLRRRDLGLAPLAGAVVISPWADLRSDAPSHGRHAAADPFAHLDDLPAYAAMYAGGHPIDAPLLSPVHADYRGLPPLLVQVGSTETLYDDAVAVARRAAAAGVPTRLEEWSGMFHTWHGHVGALHGADEATFAAAAFLRRLAR